MCLTFLCGCTRSLSDRSNNPVGCLSRAGILLFRSRVSLAWQVPGKYRIAFVYEQEGISGCFGDMSDALESLRFSRHRAGRANSA